MTDPIDCAIAHEHDRQHASWPSDYAELKKRVVEYIDFLEGEIGDSNSHWCANLELKQKVKELRAALGKDD